MSIFDDLKKQHLDLLARYAILKSKAWGDKIFLDEIRLFVKQVDSFLLKHKASLEPEKKALVRSWKEHWQGMTKVKPKAKLFSIDPQIL